MKKVNFKLFVLAAVLLTACGDNSQERQTGDQPSTTNNPATETKPGDTLDKPGATQTSGTESSAMPQNNSQQQPSPSIGEPKEPVGESEYDPLHDVNLKNLGLDPNVVLRIVVNADGLIFLDGTAAKLQDIPKSLDSLKQKKGVVWFYRANPESELQGNAMEVMKIIFSSGQAYIHFTKEDFSEAKLGGSGARMTVKSQ